MIHVSFRIMLYVDTSCLNLEFGRDRYITFNYSVYVTNTILLRNRVIRIIV